MNKIITATVLSLGIIGAGVWTASSVNADDNTNWHQNLIAKLATKFKVSEAEVQSVFDQNREEHQTQMTNTLTEKLNQAVSEGKITETQKQAILDHHLKMQEEREKDLTNWQSMSQTERKAAMQERRTEMEQWLKDNNLDENLLRDFMGEFGVRGMKTHRGMGR